jgi:prolyl 4-hydroxylase
MECKRLAEHIFVITDFLTRTECLQNMALSEQVGYEAAKINTSAGSRLRTDIRNNNRAFYKSEALAQAYWDKLQSFAPPPVGASTAIGLNELFRFYRYQRGQQFKGHYDESYIRSDREKSHYTFMVYLNDNFQGGDTAFRGLRVQPRQGMALVFLHELYHEGSEITQGVKYVLRSDVMYRTAAGVLPEEPLISGR